MNKHELQRTSGRRHEEKQAEAQRRAAASAADPLTQCLETLARLSTLLRDRFALELLARLSTLSRLLLEHDPRQSKGSLASLDVMVHRRSAPSLARVTWRRNRHTAS